MTKKEKARKSRSSIDLAALVKKQAEITRKLTDQEWSHLNAIIELKGAARLPIETNIIMFRKGMTRKVSARDKRTRYKKLEAACVNLIEFLHPGEDCFDIFFDPQSSLLDIAISTGIKQWDDTLKHLQYLHDGIKQQKEVLPRKSGNKVYHLVVLVMEIDAIIYRCTKKHIDRSLKSPYGSYISAIVRIADPKITPDAIDNAMKVCKGRINKHFDKKALE